MGSAACCSRSGTRAVILKKNRKYWLRPLAGIPLGGLFVPFCAAADEPQSALATLLGGFTAQDAPGAFDLALRVLVPLAALYLYSDAVAEDMRPFAAYVLPRRGSRTRWLLGRAAVSFLGALAFFTVCALSAALGSGLLSGGALFPPDMAKTVLVLVLTSGLCVASFSLLLNMLSLKLDKRFALLAAWMLYTPGQFLFSLLRPYWGGRLVTLYPSAQAILALHDAPLFARAAPDAFLYAIPGFTLAFSVVYCALFCAALCVWGVRAAHSRAFGL